MSRNLMRPIGAAIALVSLLYACSGGSGQSLPAQGTGGTSPAMNFRSATTTEKTESRPSLSVGSRIAARDDWGNSGSYTLVAALSTNDRLGFQRWGRSCDASLLDAPWYVALGNFSLTVPTTTLPACSTSGSGTGSGQNSSSRGSSSQSQAPGLYIIKIDIGWFSLSTEALSGPATTANDEWTFSPDEQSTSFQFGDFYAFFVAQWGTGGSSSPTATPAPTPTPIPTGVANS